MKRLVLGTFLVVLGAPSLVLAAPTPTPRATATPAPVATPAPIFAAPDPAPAADADAPAMPVARFEPGVGEPNEKTVGVGAGWSFPGPDIFTPDTVSVRFRLKSGLTIEPIVNASISQSFTHTHVVVGKNRPHVAARDYVANIGFAVQARKPMKRSGPVELHGIVTPSVFVTDSVTNGFGADDRVYDTNTTWALRWGLGVEYFPPKFEQHWSVSMDATNPLLAFVYDTTYDQASNSRTNTTTYSLGATFAPAVRGMAHLYF